MDQSLSQETAKETDVLVFKPRHTLAAVLQWVRARRAGLLAGALLGVMSLQMLAVISRKSITADEIVMIPAGYYHLVAGYFQLVDDHPPLSKILAAIPLLFIQPAETQPRDILAPPQSGNADGAYQERFWEDNRASFETISFWTRVPMIALTVALGILIFIFARELFGARAAVLAVVLFSLEPTVLAHGRVVQTDMPAAFGYLLVCFMLHRYLRARTWQRAGALGAACGLAFLAKFSMLIIGPPLAAIFAVLLWRAPRTGPRRKALMAHATLASLIALLLINAAYYFHSRELTNADALWIAQSFPSYKAAVSSAVRPLSYLLPTDMVIGILWQFWHNGEGHPASLLGMYRATGWWYYFPVAFALKVSLPFLLLSLASLVWCVHDLISNRDKKILIILIPFAIYTIFVLFSRINIGVRYYLPAYPFLFIAGGASLDWLLRRPARRFGVGIAAALLCWMGVEAVRAYPDQMTYFNQLAASRPHWWYLSDSNVEWGDDVPQLAAYLKARGETRVNAALSAGWSTLTQYGLVYVDLLSKPAGSTPDTRYVAIGASFLNGSTVPVRPIHGRLPTELERINFFDLYRHLKPEAVFGNSIYLYRIPE